MTQKLEKDYVSFLIFNLPEAEFLQGHKHILSCQGIFFLDLECVCQKFQQDGDLGEVNPTYNH